ncbi:PAS domain S-box protein [Halarchaeum sp. P4]|uniref:PAS domain S-box protein n=1 Tax=Halarchaeum sp. P4 TaxID=3421639 RepID=UPI003EB6F7DA
MPRSLSETPHSSVAERTPSGPIRVLHVDDDPAYADLVATHLTREDDRFEIAIETDPEAALERVRSAPEDVDCLVSDYDMPTLDGLELLEAVREVAPTLPFILLTGKGSEEIASEAISRGVTDYLQKTSGTEQYAILANRIRNATTTARMRRHRARYLTAIETAREGISILDADGEYIYVNETYADLYGYTPDELCGRHWTCTYLESDESFVREEILPTAQREGYWQGLTTGVRADGTTFLEDHVVAITDRGDLICTVRDVSDIYAGERELEMTLPAVEAAPIGVVITDPGREDNPIVYANERFEELTGYDEAEIIGRNCRFLQGERTDADTVADLREAIDAEEEATVELRNYRKDGTEFWNRVSVAPVENDTGDVTHFVGFQQDVTERYEREENLEATIARLEALFENSPDMVEVLDAEGRRLAVNQQCRTQLGYTEADLLGTGVWETDPDVTPDTVRETFAELEPGERRRFKSRLERHDGSTFPIEVHLIRLDLDGPPRFMAINRDISTQKHREETLKSLYESTQTLMDAPDRQTVAEHAVETARTILGRPINSLWLYDEDADVLRPVASTDAAHEVLDGIPTYSGDDSLAWGVFESGEAAVYDDLSTAPGRYNEETPLESELILPLGSHGVLAIGACEPASFGDEELWLARLFARTVEAALARAAREEQLRERREELERQNARLDAFTSIVSHDLRTPLNVATGYLGFLEDSADNEHVERIDDALERMDEIIEETLTLARQGRTIGEREPVEVAALARRCWERVESGDAILEVDGGCTVSGDADRLRHVFENLFRNAIEHGGADVTVTVGTLEDGTGFYVADDGPGIPEDQREYVFDPGYSTRDDGVGFGLAIVAEIVDAHGWTITVTESDAGGARFEVHVDGDVLD